MASADSFLNRAAAYIEDARDLSQSPSSRYDALDTARASLLDARRAHANPSVLIPLFSDLLSTATGDSSHIVRIVVPHVIEDLCYRDLKSFVPPSTSFLLRSLHDDHVLVTKRAVRALTTLFRKLIGFAVHVGIAPETFPEARLTTWLQMCSKALSYIQSTDDGLRKAATKFAESVVLAFSYSGGGASPDHFTLEYLVKRGSTSPLLDIAKLEQEGVSTVKLVASLAQQSLDGQLVSEKPNGDLTPRRQGLPPSSFMTAIFVLGILVRRRPKLVDISLPPLLNTVAAITSSIVDKGATDEKIKLNTRPRPSQAFADLSEGQQMSIVSTVKLSFYALRGFSHMRQESWNLEINRALSELASYEQAVDRRKMEAKALLASHQHQLSHQAGPSQPKAKMEPVNVSMSTNRKMNSAIVPSMLGSAPLINSDRSRPLNRQPSNVPNHQLSLSAQMPSASKQTSDSGDNMELQARAKRPRSSHSSDIGSTSGPRLSASEASTAAQALVQTMRPQEVVNFVMTRLLLNVPPDHTVPGASVASPNDLGAASRRSKKRALSTSVQSPPSVLDDPRALLSLQSHQVSNSNSKMVSHLQSSISQSSSGAKRAKRSRFASDQPSGSAHRVAGDRSSLNLTSFQTQSDSQQQTKKIVRKTMPPVTPARLSTEEADRLVTLCCKRILHREAEARSCGAAPLRLQLLARILTSLLYKRSDRPAFSHICNEACQFIVHNIERTVPLALAWLHFVSVSHEFSKIPAAKPSTASPERTGQSSLGKLNSVTRSGPTGEENSIPSSTTVTAMVTKTNLDSEPSKSIGIKVKAGEAQAKTETDAEIPIAETNSTCTTTSNIEPPNSNNFKSNHNITSIGKVEDHEDSDLEPLVSVVNHAMVVDSHSKGNKDDIRDKKSTNKGNDNSGNDNTSGLTNTNHIPVSPNDAPEAPSTQTINEPNVPVAEIEMQNQSHTQRLASANIAAGTDVQKLIEISEESTISAAEEPTGKDVTMADKSENEHIIEELLSDSDDGSESEIGDGDDNSGKKNVIRDGGEAIYAELFHRILTMLQKEEAVKADVFGKLISDAPIVPQGIFQFMCALCTDPASIKKGLQTVCIVAMQRPGDDRLKCLSLLFDLACNDDDAVRGPAVRLICNKMFVEPGQLALQQLIEEGVVREIGKSVDAFVSSFSTPPVRDDDSHSRDLKKSELRLQRVSMLLTALCAQKHDLVLHLGLAFVKLPRPGKNVLKQRAVELAGHVGIETQPFVDLLSGKLLGSTLTQSSSCLTNPSALKDDAKQGKMNVSNDGLNSDMGPGQLKASDGAEELALAILQSGIQRSGAKNSRIVDAAINRYESCGDMEFVIAVLEGLPREQVIGYLAKLVDYSDGGWKERKRQMEKSEQSGRTKQKNKECEEAGDGNRDEEVEGSLNRAGTSNNEGDNDIGNNREVFKEVINKVMGKQGVGMSADDFLMELHKVKFSPAVGAALRQCFEHRGIFVQQSIAQAIQHLMDGTEIPDMMMRTVMLARVFYPEMEAYLTDTVMTGLISKKVWTNHLLWDGFVRYCIKIKKAAIKLLLKLPVTQLEDALRRRELSALFRDLFSKSGNSKNLKKIPPLHRKVIMAALKKSS